jgi:hypothetical protein
MALSTFIRAWKDDHRCSQRITFDLPLKKGYPVDGDNDKLSPIAIHRHHPDAAVSVPG